MKNPVLDNIISRRSIRSYTSQPIPADVIDSVLEAGAWAASGMNLQGWKIVYIQTAQGLALLNEALRQACLNMPVTPGMPEFMQKMNAQASDPTANFLFNSPAYILVTYDQAQGNAMADSSLALGNMMLAAHSLGLGTCWHNLAARLTNSPAIAEYLAKIGLPQGHRIYGTLSIGYPSGDQPAPPARKPDVIVRL